MKKMITFLLVAFIGCGMIKAQPTITLPHITNVVAGDTLHIPVLASNIENLSSLSLTISYWNTVLQYVGYSPVHFGIADGFTNVTYQPGGATDWINISWFSLTPVSIMDDTLYLLHCKYWGGYTALNLFPLAGFITNNGSVGGTAGIDPFITSNTAVFMFPNPVKIQDGMIQVNLPSGMYRLRIISMEGKIKVAGTLPITNPGEINLRNLHLQPGIYIFSLENTLGRHTQQIIIQ